MRMLANGTRILGGAFVLSLALSAQTFTTLYSFSSQDYGADEPLRGVVLGPQGVLYGVSALGGKWDLGTVYELLPPVSSGGDWTQVVLHSFNDEAGWNGWLVMGPSASLYGVTSSGVFKLDPPTGTSSQWRYTVIYDGAAVGSLVFGVPLGYGQSLYGTANCAFSLPGGPLCAAVYGLTPPPVAGGPWTYSTVYNLPGGTPGSRVAGGFAVGAGGTLFGVTSDGGYDGGFCSGWEGCGTVFSLTPPAAAGGPWTEAILRAFNPGVGDGNRPKAGLVIGPGGVLYGTTFGGGQGYAGCEGDGGAGGGTVFSLTPPSAAGEPMTETILHEFGVSEGDGCSPATTLVLGPNGVLYGTTEYGGASNDGTAFGLTPPASAGGSWIETILHSFSGKADGRYPNELTLAPDGTLYGTTTVGGAYAQGTMFAITP